MLRLSLGSGYYIVAAAKGQNDMAVGNAVGSVTANIGLIMSISILCMPALVKRKEVAFKGTLMIAAVAALALFINNLSLTTVQSVIMIIIFAVFMPNGFFLFGGRIYTIIVSFI